MNPRIKKFSEVVARTIEFAGYGPCHASNGVVSVQAFDEIKRYPINPDLSLVGTWQPSAPGLLSPTTYAVLTIIKDAYVSKGMPEPGANAVIAIAAPDLPFAVEVRYLWMVDPSPDHTEDQRLVVCTAFVNGQPVWATESTIAYQSKKDTDLTARVGALASTYRDSPQPDVRFIKMFPEIVDAVASIVK